MGSITFDFRAMWRRSDQELEGARRHAPGPGVDAQVLHHSPTTRLPTSPASRGCAQSQRKLGALGRPREHTANTQFIVDIGIYDIGVWLCGDDLKLAIDSDLN